MHCFLAFLAGVLLFSLFAYFPYAAAFILFFIVFALLGKRRYLVVPVLIAGILYACMRCGPAVEIPCSNDRYFAQGIFTTFPVRTKSGLIRQSFLIERAENQRTGEPAHALAGKEIMILAEEGSRPYTEYLAEIRFSGIGAHRNPGEYGEQPLIAYLAGISGQGSTKEPLFAHIQEFRYRINEYLTGRFDRETGAFLASVTTGEQAFIDEAVRNAFNTTGLTHILSISGSHFGLFSVVLYTLFRMLIALLPYRVLQRITLFLTPSQGAAILCFPFRPRLSRHLRGEHPCNTVFYYDQSFPCGSDYREKEFLARRPGFCSGTPCCLEPRNLFQRFIPTVIHCGIVYRVFHEDGRAWRRRGEKAVPFSQECRNDYPGSIYRHRAAGGVPFPLFLNHRTGNKSPHRTSYRFSHHTALGILSVPVPCSPGISSLRRCLHRSPGLCSLL